MLPCIYPAIIIPAANNKHAKNDKIKGIFSFVCLTIFFRFYQMYVKLFGTLSSILLGVGQRFKFIAILILFPEVVGTL